MALSIDDIAKLYRVKPELLAFLKEPDCYQHPENVVRENYDELRREWEKALSAQVDSTGVDGTSAIGTE